MFHVHSSCISCKTLKAISNQVSVNSRYRDEPESKKSNGIDIPN